MYRNDVKVKRPEKTKTQKKGDVTYVSHVVSQTYIKEKKHALDTRVMIGKMIDDEFMVPNEKYFLYYKDENLLEQPPQFNDALQAAVPIVVDKIVRDLNLKDILTNIHGGKSKLLQDLITYVITEETSSLQHYPDYAFNHMICSDSISSDSKISSFLKNDINATDTQEFLRQWNEIQEKSSDLYISYDSTNMGTRAEGIELAEFGHAKDNSNLKQVNISYATKVCDGTPVLYEMYPGSVIDNSQLKYMVKLLREYGYEGIGLIIDRGYFSRENINMCDENNINLIMMVKNNTVAIKEQFEKQKYVLKGDFDNFIDNHEVYGVTVKDKLWKSDKKTKYIHIYYDNVRANVERNEHYKMIKSLEKELTEKISKKITKDEQLNKYKKYFRLYFDDYGYLETYKTNNKRVQEDADKLGYFVLVTSKEMSAEDALDIYRKRDSTEKMFKILKTHLEYDTYRVHSVDSLQGKTYLMFLASIVRNQFLESLRPLQKDDKKKFTVPSAIKELEKLTIFKERTGKYLRRYALTSKQKKILNQFNIDEEYFDNIINEI